MNKKVVIFGLLLLLFSLFCIFSGWDSTMLSHSQDSQESQESQESKTDNCEYKADDGRFKIVSTEKVDDGKTKDMTILILVDKETNVMYIQSEKYSCGWGLSLEVMVDKDGKPLIYNGELD